MFWTIVINLAIAALASYLQPKPEPPKAAEIGDIELPVAKEGREVGRAYGSPWIKQPNIVWYGDLNKTAIKSKQPKK